MPAYPATSWTEGQDGLYSGMLSHLPEIQRTVQGMGILAQTQRPFVRFLIKNWPLTLVAGFALFAKGRERYGKGELNTYNVLADAGLVLSPLVGLALINQLAAQSHAEALGLPAPAPVGIPVIAAAPAAAPGAAGISFTAPRY